MIANLANKRAGALTSAVRGVQAGVPMLDYTKFMQRDNTGDFANIAGYILAKRFGG